MTVIGIDARRLGTSLIVLGILGVAVATAVALSLVVAGGSIRSTVDDLQGSRPRIAAAIRDSAASVGTAARTVKNLGTTLSSTEDVLRDTSDVLTSLGTTSSNLSSALDISILGQRPFDAAASSLADLSSQLTGYAGNVEALADDLIANRGDIASIGSELLQLQTRLEDLALRIDDFDQGDRLVSLAGWGLLLLGALAAWVAASGGLMAWLGWRLRKMAAVAASSAGSLS